MGTEAAPRLPGSTGCILMFTQFLQLCPWKGHSGCCVPPGGTKEPPICQGLQPPSCVPQSRRGLCKGLPVPSTAWSLPCWSQGWGLALSRAGGVRSAEHHPREHSPMLCMAKCCCRQDAFDPLPSPISLPLNTNFDHPGVWQEQDV